MSKYAAFVQSAFQTQLAYRGQVWASLFGRFIQVSAWVAIWVAVYRGQANVGGITLPAMVTYAVIGSTVTTGWDWRKLIYSLGNSISSGDVAVYLLKPLAFPLYLFATECGNLAYKMLVVALPVALFSALVYGMQPPASVFHGVMFGAFFVLSFLIMFLLAALCGMISFWLMTAFSLEWMLQGILTLLAGSQIPLWFFPDAFVQVAKLLPFAWIGYHPIAVYLGTTSVVETWSYLALGLGWAGLMALGVALLWRAAATRLVVQGRLIVAQALRVIPFLVQLYVKSRMEYRGAFLLAIGAQFFSYACGYAAIWVLLLKFQTLGGWTWPQLALLFSFQLLTYSMGAATSFVQLRDIEEKVRLGTIDTLLVKPFSPWAYLVFSGLNIGYAGHIALAGAMLGWALTQVGIDWNFGTVLYLLAALLSAAMINAALITMVGACAFIFVQSSPLYTIFFGVWDLSRYPLTIFPAGLQWLLLTGIPLGFASFVPMAVLLGKEVPILGWWGGPLALLAGPALVLLAMAHWRYAIARYQGAGG